MTETIVNPMETQREGGRRYHSPKRQAQAAATRSHLIAAATELFAERGFLGTTMADVAARAGVSTPMVYAVFETKAKLLAAAIGAAVRGDNADEPLRERADWKDMLASADGQLMIERFAVVQHSVNARVWSLIEAARAAAASDPGIAELVTAGARNRWSDCRSVAAALADKRQLRPGVTIDQAADLLWSMCSSELYRMLVVERAWTPYACQQWVAEALGVRLLTAPGRSAQER